MDVNELVLMGYVPKPRETLNDFLKSGEKWYEANEKFKEDFKDSPEDTLKLIKIHFPDNDLGVQLLSHPPTKYLNLIGLDNPKFPMISYPPKSCGTTWVPVSRVLKKPLLSNCSTMIKVRYKNTTLPIVLIDYNRRNKDYVKCHELSHCVRRRFRFVKGVRNYIYNEAIAFKSMPYLNEEFYDQIKDFKDRNSFSGALHIPSTIVFLSLNLPYVLLGIPNMLLTCKKLVYDNLTLPDYIKNLYNDLEHFFDVYGKENILQLGHRVTRKEFMDITDKTSKGDNLSSIINEYIKESREKYKWRWESIKEDLNLY